MKLLFNKKEVLYVGEKYQEWKHLLSYWMQKQG